MNHYLVDKTYDTPMHINLKPPTHNINEVEKNVKEKIKGVMLKYGTRSSDACIE